MGAQHPSQHDRLRGYLGYRIPVSTESIRHHILHHTLFGHEVSDQGSSRKYGPPLGGSPAALGSPVPRHRWSRLNQGSTDWHPWRPYEQFILLIPCFLRRCQGLAHCLREPCLPDVDHRAAPGDVVAPPYFSWFSFQCIMMLKVHAIHSCSSILRAYRSLSCFWCSWPHYRTLSLAPGVCRYGIEELRDL